jgi:hypothetical protein
MIREWAMKKVHNNIIHNLWWILQPFYFRVWLITVVKYKTRRDPNVVIANKEDTYQWVYKNLPENITCYGKFQPVSIVVLWDSIAKHQDSVAGKGRFTFMCMTYHLKYVIYLRVKQIVMPIILEPTYVISTRIFLFTSFDATVDECTATTKGIYRIVCVILLLWY